MKDVHERKSSIEVENALRRMLDFPCFIQIVPDKIVAFEMAMLNYYDVIILPLTSEDPFSTAAFVEIISSVDESPPAMIYMVNHDEHFDVAEKSRYIRMSAEFTLNIRELVQAIVTAIEPPSVDAVSPGNHEQIQDLFRQTSDVLPPAAAALSIAASPKHSPILPPSNSRSAGSKRKRSKKEKDAEHDKVAGCAKSHDEFAHHGHGHGYPEGRRAPTEAETAAYHHYWRQIHMQQWQAQQHMQEYMYPAMHPDNQRDAYYGCTSAEASADSRDSANDYLVTSTASSSDSEHDPDFDHLAAFDYGILMVDESVAFDAFD